MNRKISPYIDKSRNKRIEILTENLMKIVESFPELKENDIPLYPISSENAPIYSKLCSSIKDFVIDEIYDVFRAHRYK